MKENKMVIPTEELQRALREAVARTRRSVADRRLDSIDRYIQDMAYAQAGLKEAFDRNDLDVAALLVVAAHLQSTLASKL
jgi:hypothetical protein